MPLTVSGENARQLIHAAYSSRLNPYTLHPGEHQLLSGRISDASITLYLTIRNGILRLWTRNPLLTVSREEALESTKGRYVTLVLFAHEWLARNGYINFGCVEIPALKVGAPGYLAKPKTIVVIGAGISGLCCARQLQGLFKQFQERWARHRREKTPRVIVLEGRNRIGGRVYSHPLRRQTMLSQSQANTAELGAQIITGFDRGNPLDAIVRGQLALGHHLMKDNMILYDHDGSIIDEKRDIQMQKLFNDLLETASAHSWKPHTKLPIDGHQTLTISGQATVFQNGTISPAPEVEDEKVTKVIVDDENHPTLGAHLDRLVEQYQKSIGLSAQDLRLLNWHYANMEYANAINVDQLSLGGWDQDSGNEFEGRHAEIIGGYTQVPRGLWSYPDKLDVRLNKIVDRIRYRGSEDSPKAKARVYCRNGEIFEADEVISTLSLGVLQESTTHFDPPLPEWKLGAMQRMGFGVLNKIVLVFDHVFWEKDRDMFGLLNESVGYESLVQKDYVSQRGKFYLFWNCVKISGLPMLTGLMAGDAAKEAETSSDQELMLDATEKLARMFLLPSRPVPREVIVTRWRKDPFARGSYSYLGPRAEPGDYDSMAKSVGNLHFAGEATCGTHPATVHGAYLSGLRAASDVVESLIGPIPVPVEEQPIEHK